MKEQFKEAFSSLLKHLGRADESVEETPERAAKFYTEFLDREKWSTYKRKTFEAKSSQLIVQNNIPFYSLCEHHVLPFFGLVHIGYIPHKRMIGLSKFARIVKQASHNIHTQEALAEEIGKLLSEQVEPQGVVVVIQARHTCYDEETEVLTDKGFKFFKDLTEEDKVAQYHNIPEKLINYRKPNSIVCYDFDGDMVSVEGKTTNFLVTPDHRCLTKTEWKHYHGENPYEVVLADSLKPKMFVPKAGLFLGSDITTPVTINGIRPTHLEFCKFMGAYLSEGCYSPNDNRVRISQKSSSKGFVPFYQLLVQKFGFRRNGNVFEVFDEKLNDYLRQFGRSRDKYIPMGIFLAPIVEREAFLHYYFLGDGNKNEFSKSFSITTTSEKMANDLQHLSVITGRSCTLRKRKSGAYNVNFHVRGDGLKDAGSISAKAISKKPYKGKVYCANVNSSFLVIRRKGCVTVSGNCMEMRGVEALGTFTTTSFLSGTFMHNSNLKQEFMSLIPQNPRL